MDYIAAGAIISGLVQAIKDTGIPSKFMPLVAIILGVIYSVYANTSYSFETILWGVTVGLSAVGMYEGAKGTKSEIQKVIKK